MGTEWEENGHTANVDVALEASAAEGNTYEPEAGGTYGARQTFLKT